MRERIRPALEAGTWVLCDRFLDSSTVYQGVARGLPAAAVASVNAFAIGGLLPDRTLLLDVPVKESLRRVHARAPKGADRMEAAPESFYRSVREGYLALAQAHPERFRVFDGTADAEAISAQIRAALAPLLAP